MGPVRTGTLCPFTSEYDLGNSTRQIWFYVIKVKSFIQMDCSVVFCDKLMSYRAETLPRLVPMQCWWSNMPVIFYKPFPICVVVFYPVWILLFQRQETNNCTTVMILLSFAFDRPYKTCFFLIQKYGLSFWSYVTKSKISSCWRLFAKVEGIHRLVCTICTWPWLQVNTI